MRIGPAVVCVGVVIVVVAAVMPSRVGRAVGSTHFGLGLPGLEKITSIQGSDSFSIASAVGLETCELVLVAGTWGTLVRVGPTGVVSDKPRRIPGGPMGVVLESVRNDEIPAWSRDPPWLGVIDIETLQVRGVPVPNHPWSKLEVGPVTGMDRGLYAMAAISDPGFPRAEPRSWLGTPLISLFDVDGVVQHSLGEIADREGRYLTWLGSRASIGVIADTLLAVFLADATLERFELTPQGWIRPDRGKGSLPRYLRAPEPIEEVRSAPWIDVNGDLPRVHHVPQVAAAAVGPGGKIFALRNYEARWVAHEAPTWRVQRRWEVTSWGLEVYDSFGEVEGRFAFPVGQKTGRWIRVDPVGRLLMPEPGGVGVWRDPTYTGPTCPAVPSVIPVSSVDAPPSPDSILAYPW